jgi:hypothetical protein
VPNIQGRNDVRVHDDAVIDYCLARLLETNDGGEECLDKQLAPGCQIVEVPLEAMGLHPWGVLGAHPPPLTARTHARRHAPACHVTIPASSAPYRCLLAPLSWSMAHVRTRHLPAEHVSAAHGRALGDAVKDPGTEQEKVRSNSEWIVPPCCQDKEQQNLDDRVLYRLRVIRMLIITLD